MKNKNILLHTSTFHLETALLQTDLTAWLDLQSSPIPLLKVQKQREKKSALHKLLLVPLALSGKGCTDLSSTGSDLEGAPEAERSFAFSPFIAWSVSVASSHQAVCPQNQNCHCNIIFFKIFVTVFLSQPRSSMNGVCSASALKGIDRGWRVLSSLDVASRCSLRVSRRETFNPPNWK